jgi:hypothetical protein
MMIDPRGRSLAMLVLLMVVATACAGDATELRDASSVSATSRSSGPEVATFAETDDPTPVEAGTYRIARSPWSVRDFTVTFPEGWTVQYGHVYAAQADTDAEFYFYAVAGVDEIYADACEGDKGDLMKVGRSVDDLIAALLQQPGPKATGPVGTALGGYPAKRIDFKIPEDLDLTTCSYGDIGIQIWHSSPTDKYFVLLPGGHASAYILNVDGRRQVFLTQYGPATSDEDVRQLQTVLDSIRIEN